MFAGLRELSGNEAICDISFISLGKNKLFHTKYKKIAMEYYDYYYVFCGDFL